MTKFLVCAALLSGTLTAMPAAAAITTIDFNSEANNGVPSLIYPSVTITSPGGQLFTTSFGNTPNGTRGISGYESSTGGTPLRADFTSPVNFVSIDLGDYFGDEDDLYLRAYDAGNNLLAAQTQLMGELYVGMITLSLSASGVAYVEFGGIGAGGTSSVYADNLTFGTRGAVPEPASWALLIAGFGLVGAVQRRRKAALA